VGLDSQFGRKAASATLMASIRRLTTSPHRNVITSTYGGLTANADMAVLDLFART